MTTIPALSGPAAAPEILASKDGAGRLISSDFQTFLKMLTAQIKNQDPLDPMDSADYAVQLATFSGVEQQVRTNDLLGGLSGQLGGAGIADLAAWVGREVRAPGPGSFEGSPLTAALDPSGAAERAELLVTDAQGREVQRLTAPTAGGNVEWAGVGADGTPLPHGLYGFELVSHAGGQELDRTPVETYARVHEVRTGDGGATLVLSGGVEIAAAQVSALREAR